MEISETLSPRWNKSSKYLILQNEELTYVGEGLDKYRSPEDVINAECEVEETNLEILKFFNGLTDGGGKILSSRLTFLNSPLGNEMIKDEACSLLKSWLELCRRFKTDL